MTNKPAKRVDKDTGVTVDANDADESRTVEGDPADVEAARKGKLSAARIGGNNVPGSDEIAVPGYIETAAVGRAKKANS